MCRVEPAQAEMNADNGLAQVAAAIGEPARTRMLCRLLDGRARTATELAMTAGVSASTASVHLQKLETARLVRATAQGKHRYYSLEGARVARALESLSVIAGSRGLRSSGNGEFAPTTPSGLRAARSCYDHMAGVLGVALHDRIRAMGWIEPRSDGANSVYETTQKGEAALSALGIDVGAAAGMRRRFAFPCLDWSERRPHLAGALGAELLGLALKRKWVVQDLDSRALEVTLRGRREMQARFGIAI